MADQITDNRTLVDIADAVDPGGTGTWADETHANMFLNLDTTTFVRGTGSISDRVSGTTGIGGIGWYFEADTDLGGNVMYVWANFGQAGALATTSAGGLTYYQSRSCLCG